nr:MAG TPA: hypothetical protein [Caudoviricetes sp.]
MVALLLYALPFLVETVLSFSDSKHRLSFSRLFHAIPFQSFSLQFLIFSCLFMLICYFSYPC